MPTVARDASTLQHPDGSAMHGPRRSPQGEALRGKLAKVNVIDKPVLMYATFPDAAIAAVCARRLVEGRLAACANILPAMTSIYRWEGRIEEAPEFAMLIKTRAHLVELVIEAVRSGHPYSNPAVLVLDVTGGAPAFLDWIMAETAPVAQHG